MADPKPGIPQNLTSTISSLPASPKQTATPTTPKPTLKIALPTQPRRAILAYKAARTTNDIASLKKHIVNLEKELATTRAKVAEEEEKRQGVPRLVKKLDLRGVGSVWGIESEVTAKGKTERVVKDAITDTWEANYEVEEFSESDAQQADTEGSEKNEDVYILDGGNTVISVQELGMNSDNSWGDGEDVVKVSKKVVEQGKEGYLTTPIDGYVWDGQMMSPSLENLAAFATPVTPEGKLGELGDIVEGVED